MSDSEAPPAPNRIDMPPWPQNPTMKTYIGACHCRKFEFKVEHPVFEDGSFPVTNCNCSLCTCKALLLIYTPRERFQFTSGSWEEATTYRFNKGIISHYFCPVCGVHFCGTGTKMMGVNVRTLGSIDVDKLTLKPFDGKTRL